MSTPESNRFKENPNLPVDPARVEAYRQSLMTNYEAETNPDQILEALFHLDQMGILTTREIPRPVRFVARLIPERLRRRVFPAIEDLNKVIGRQRFMEDGFNDLLQQTESAGNYQAVMNLVRVGHLLGYTEDPQRDTELTDKYEKAKTELAALAAAPPPFIPTPPPAAPTPPPAAGPNPNVNVAPNPNVQVDPLQKRKDAIMDARAKELADPASTARAEWDAAWDGFVTRWDQKIQPQIDALPNFSPDDLGEVFRIAFGEIQGLILGSQSTLKVRAGIQVIVTKIRDLSGISDMHFSGIVDFMSGGDSDRKDEERERLAAYLFMPESSLPKLMTVNAPHVGKDLLVIDAQQPLTTAEKQQVTKIKRAIARATHPDISGSNPFVDTDLLEDLDFLMQLYSDFETKINNAHDKS